jgi:cytochrome c
MAWKNGNCLLQMTMFKALKTLKPLKLTRPLLPVLLPVLALALQASPALATGDPEKGRALFARCASCHQVGPSARNGFGPQLNGVIGRRAGSVEGYAYSPAMKNATLVWSEKNLRTFLKSPGDTVPGNKRRFWGISSDSQIADLLAYLRQYP